MADDSFDAVLDEEGDFDPLQADDLEIDQEDMDEDNPQDTVDYPTMRNMPEHMQREAVYTPEVQGSAAAAMKALFDRNPARRGILLAIIDLCREGRASSEVAVYVDELQKDNRSVYAPMTLCRMLERAGGLEMEAPAGAEEKEDVSEGVEYLEIKQRPDPVWTATPAALEVYDELTQGAAFKDILGRDGIYKEVYRAVMQLAADAPRSREEIEQLVDGFEVVENPRRFGGHFIDMLERTDVLIWRDHSWQLTEMGRTMLAGMQAE